MERIKHALEKARRERVLITHSVVKPVGNGIANAAQQHAAPGELSLCSESMATHGVVTGTTSTPAASAYRRLRAHVLRNMSSNGWKTLAVTSPNAREGKTLTAINIAFSIARDVDNRVTLVDMDLRKPCIHRYLGCTPTRGVSDFVKKTCTAESIVFETGYERLRLVPGRETVADWSDDLSSVELSEFVSLLKNTAPSGFVVIDFPAVLQSGDLIACASVIDAVLLVIEDGVTKQKEMRHAVGYLQGMQLAGVVLNRSGEKLTFEEV